MMVDRKRQVEEIFSFLYGPEQASSLTERVYAMLDRAKDLNLVSQEVDPSRRVNAADVIMIAYGDMVQDGERKVLDVLHQFAAEHLQDIISTIHILPFFPYSSDDGFSVIDYKKVKPEWGDWSHIARLTQNFDLMVDVVVNHISQYSAWFQGFLAQTEPYTDYFISVDPGADLSEVFRPRALPLLTEVETSAGKKHVWTTFSPDQIDLNFSNPEVLLEILELFLFYVRHGARFIRLDAVAFIWKEIGSTCMHLPQVHKIVELTRLVLDEAAPQVVLITETNVPHPDNISYFGDGHGEAQMVYNFSLPPLVLHSIQKGDASSLKKWAETLILPSDEVTFFNFLASHDGIGLLPARGILTEAEIADLAEHTLLMGGRVSYKNNADGSKSPYEMNINYLDATRPSPGFEPAEKTTRRFLAAQAVLLMLRGVPGIYYHSLLGSQNWTEGMELSGQNRTINREKLNVSKLTDELNDPDTLRSLVFSGYRDLLKIRRRESAFDPYGVQLLIDTPQGVFGVYRCARNQKSGLYCFANLADKRQTFKFQLNSQDPTQPSLLKDQVSGQILPVKEGQVTLDMAPYQVALCSGDFN